MRSSSPLREPPAHLSKRNPLFGFSSSPTLSNIAHNYSLPQLEPSLNEQKLLMASPHIQGTGREVLRQIYPQSRHNYGYQSQQTRGMRHNKLTPNSCRSNSYRLRGKGSESFNENNSTLLDISGTFGADSHSFRFTNNEEKGEQSSALKLKLFREVIFRMSDKLSQKRTLQAIFNALVDIDTLAQRAVLSHDLALQEALNVAQLPGQPGLNLLDESNFINPTTPVTPIDNLVQSISVFLSKAKRKIGKVVDTQKMVSQQYLDKVRQLEHELRQNTLIKPNQMDIYNKPQMYYSKKEEEELRREVSILREQLQTAKVEISQERRISSGSIARERESHKQEMAEVSQLVNKLRSTIIDLEDENSVYADKNKRLERKIQEIMAEGGVPSYFRSPASSERSSFTSRGDAQSLVMAVEQLKKKLSEERKSREEEGEKLQYALRKAEKESKIKEVEVEQLRQEYAKLRDERERSDMLLSEQLKESRQAYDQLFKEKSKEIKELMESKTAEFYEMEKKARQEVEDALIEQRSLKVTNETLSQKWKKAETELTAVSSEKNKLQEELEVLLVRMNEHQKQLMGVEISLREKDSQFENVLIENENLRLEMKSKIYEKEKLAQEWEEELKVLKQREEAQLFERKEKENIIHEKELLLQQHEEMIEKLKEKLETKKELEDIVIKASNELKGKEARIAELERTEEQLKLELVESEAIKMRQNEVETKFGALEERLQAEQQELEENEKFKGKQKEEIMALRKELSMIVEGKQRMEKQLGEYEQLLQIKEADSNRLRVRLKAAEEDSANKTAGIEKAEIIIKKLNNESQFILDENMRLNEEYDKLEKQTVELEEQLKEDALRLKQFAEVRESEQRLKEENERIAEEIAQKDEEIQERTKQYEELDANYQELQSQCKLASQKLQELLERVETSETQNQELVQQVEELSKEKEELETELERLKKEAAENEEISKEKLKEVCRQAERSLSMFSEHFSKSKRGLSGRIPMAKALQSLSPRPPAITLRRSPFRGDKDSSPHAHQRGRINTTYFPESVQIEQQTTIIMGQEEEEEEQLKKNPHDLALLEAKETTYTMATARREQQCRIVETLEKELLFVSKRLSESQASQSQQMRLNEATEMRCQDLSTRLFQEVRKSAAVINIMKDLKQALKEKEHMLQKYKHMWQLTMGQVKEKSELCKKIITEDADSLGNEIVPAIEALAAKNKQLEQELEIRDYKLADYRRLHDRLAALETKHTTEIEQLLARISELESQCGGARNEVIGLRAVLDQIRDVLSLGQQGVRHVQETLPKRVKELVLDNQHLTRQMVAMQTTEISPDKEMEAKLGYLDNQNHQLVEQIERMHMQREADAEEFEQKLGGYKQEIDRLEAIAQQKEILINNLNQQMSKESRTYHTVRDELQSVREAREEEILRQRSENKGLRSQMDSLRGELEEVRGKNLELHRRETEFEDKIEGIHGERISLVNQIREKQEECDRMRVALKETRIELELSRQQQGGGAGPLQKRDDKEANFIEQSKKFMHSIHETDLRLKELLRECKPVAQMQAGQRDSIDWRNTSLPQVDIESLPGGGHYKTNSLETRGPTRLDMLSSSINHSTYSGGVELFEQVLEQKNNQINTMEKFISSMQKEIKKKFEERRGSAQTQKYPPLIPPLQHMRATQEFQPHSRVEGEVRELRRENEILRKQLNQQYTGRSRNSEKREYSFAEQQSPSKQRHDSLPSSHHESAHFPQNRERQSGGSIDALHRKIQKLETRKDIRKKKHQKQLRDIDYMLRYIEAKVMLNEDETRYFAQLKELEAQNPTLSKWLREMSAEIEKLHKLARGGQVFTLEIFSSLESDQKREVLSEVELDHGTPSKRGPLETELEKKIKAILLDPRLLSKTVNLMKNFQFGRSDYSTENSMVVDQDRFKVAVAVENSLNFKIRSLRELSDSLSREMTKSGWPGVLRDFNEIIKATLRALSSGLESDTTLLNYIHLSSTHLPYDSKSQDLFQKLWKGVQESVHDFLSKRRPPPMAEETKQQFFSQGVSNRTARSGIATVNPVTKLERLFNIVRSNDHKFSTLLKQIDARPLSQTTAYLVRLFNSHDPQIEQFMEGFESALKTVRRDNTHVGENNELDLLNSQKEAIDRCCELITTLNETEGIRGEKRLWREALYWLLKEQVEIKMCLMSG